MAADDFIFGFLAGCAAIIASLALVAFSLVQSGDVYGLGHWKLNVKAPFPSMWMNLGYWQVVSHTDVSIREEKPVCLIKNEKT